MLNANTVPIYVTGKSKDDLVSAMIKNNQLYGISFKYFSISYAKGEWVAWFQCDAGVVLTGKLDQKASGLTDG